MKRLTTTEWIAHFLAADPPRSKSLVMTLFGDAIAPHGGSIWLGSLIELAAPFGIGDRLVRTSVFRLAQEGWLAASRDGRRSAYSIEPQAQRRFEHANHRIYAPLDAHWNGAWTLLIAGAADIGAQQRAQLRKELLWEGYTAVAQGVFGHPASNAEILEDILARTGTQGKLVVCTAAELPGVSTRPLKDLVQDGWDLAPVIAAYRQFADQFAPLQALLDKGAALEPQEAFVIRTLLIHAYRRVQLHDPMLPIELLPDPWPGAQAYDLARDIYRYAYGQAESWLMEVLGREQPGVERAGKSFYDRFGGLR
ncbi:MAG: phenylacetic acid degradation operon negative regulatory protein PaaX [Telluria sp.]